MLVTVSVFTILAVIATPFVTDMFAAQEGKGVRKTIENSIKEAKIESLSLRHDVLLCLADASGSCHKDGSEKLLLFIDNNDDENYSVASDTLVREYSLLPKYGTMHLRAANRHYVLFQADSGTPRGYMGHIKYCPLANYRQQKYKVSFNMVGIATYKPDSVAEPTDCT